MVYDMRVPKIASTVAVSLLLAFALLTIGCTKRTAKNPVSYTHLDVYKRQVLGPAQRQFSGIVGLFDSIASLNRRASE